MASTPPSPETSSSSRDAAGAVVVNQVTKTFGRGEARTPALKGVNFETKLGELHMVVGPSGCGKTTLLSVIAGTLEFDGGEVSVFGSSFHRMTKPEITLFRGQSIGFIFQQFNLIPTLSLAENVSVPLLLNGVSRREAETRARDLLKRVGLGDRVKDVPLNLSGGQQQRVAIARALVHEPRLVICDEPTSALDRDTGQRVMELLSEVSRSAARLVVVVTHDSRIFKFADRMTEMEDGRVIKVHDDPSAFASGYH